MFSIDEIREPENRVSKTNFYEDLWSELESFWGKILLFEVEDHVSSWRGTSWRGKPLPRRWNRMREGEKGAIYRGTGKSRKSERSDRWLNRWNRWISVINEWIIGKWILMNSMKHELMMNRWIIGITKWWLMISSIITSRNQDSWLVKHQDWWFLLIDDSMNRWFLQIWMIEKIMLCNLDENDVTNVIRYNTYIECSLWSQAPRSSGTLR